MKCHGCDKELLKREHAQPMHVFGVRCWPKSFCDECCKANPWAVGSVDALKRLTSGKTDYEELARIEALTPVRLTEPDPPMIRKEAA